MDSHNLFFTRATYSALRLEYLAALATVVGLTLAHLDEVRWVPFAVLFLTIDLVGYIPGAVAWRKAPDHRISRTYFVLYNVMHSHLTAGAVALVWSLVSGPEWALLALAIHQCGDRSIFGNFPKPYGLSFEPQTHPAYQELVDRYDRPRDTVEPVARRHGAPVTA
jgi:hypothetical protein